MNYTIEIWSRGVDVGIGTLTKEQYEYWSEQDTSDLENALNNDYDYEENEAPDNVKLKEYYNEYDDVFFGFGADRTYNEMTIKDENGNVVYDGNVDDYIEKYDPEYDVDLTDTGDRDYYSGVLDAGYYVQWCQAGKGLYFDGGFEADNFDPLKLQFMVRETDYAEILVGIKYDGEELDNDAGDYDIKSFEAVVFSVNETVYQPTIDLEKVEKVLQFLVDNMMYDPENLEIGENISDVTEVKIIFDGYGETDDGEANKDMESYAIFIHKNSGDTTFEFPEHDTTPWGLVHRPDEEVCVWAWHNVEDDSWEFGEITDTNSNLQMHEIDQIIGTIYNNYDLGEEGDEDGDDDSTPSVAWPFPTERP